MWVFSLPRLARDAANFAQDVKWLVGVARGAFSVPAPQEPQVELASNFRLQERYEPEPWSREYENWDPGWTLVRTTTDPFHAKNPRLM